VALIKARVPRASRLDELELEKKYASVALKFPLLADEIRLTKREGKRAGKTGNRETDRIEKIILAEATRRR
jgi:hypothetical protein